MPVVATPNHGTGWPQPQGGLPLALTFSPGTVQNPQTVLIVGQDKLAAARAFTFLESSFHVTILGSLALACEELVYRAQQGQVTFLDVCSSGGEWQDQRQVGAWENLLRGLDGISMVLVTDTVLTFPLTTATTTSSKRRSLESASALYKACQSAKLPINTTDYADLSTFTFPSVARFPGRLPGSRSNLQIAVSTNGKGCRLAGRIRRELVAKLPREVGAAVDSVGELRQRAKKLEAVARQPSLCPRKRQKTISAEYFGQTHAAMDNDDDVSFVSGSGPLNSPVPQLHATTPSTPLSPSDQLVTPPLTDQDNQLRRMKWISQISEYWSFQYLARMKPEDMETSLEMWSAEAVTHAPATLSGGNSFASLDLTTHSDAQASSSSPLVPTGANPSIPSRSSHGLKANSLHQLDLAHPPAVPTKRGRILLLGSGPGHPSLLTVAAHQALHTATLILSDKLVPSEILALIPKTTRLHIAKKFPGNAEGAQNEMMQLALEGALRGEIVVRLKQGDPFVYGRGGEEVLFFRQHGFECVVVPGISSALAGPLMMGIPVTQRGVAESMVLCTGVGRKGKAVQLPGYVKSRTLIVLMGVARIKQVLEVLTTPHLKDAASDKETTGWRDGAVFPRHLPIAIIERASSHDQRMVASTLDKIEDALERSGEQRPPGMMIIGWAALALEGEGQVTVLDDEDDDDDEERDKARVAKWLGGKDYILKDGLGDEWAQFLPSNTSAAPEATVTEI